ncbi:MAG: uncharacterized protein KVP18_004267 [Porospora cf. gigantea A]|uniref:uncharacterized protein n=1 Tax=Porospora cf. gigantea A TaxID=2853593 RepID=UPI00355A7F22|nr:MAG: hypothetical protein KVP18_004267 [Porospora cf. gigantea A]
MDVLMPKKAEHRQRAHCNPLSDGALEYPTSPDHVDWSVHFPQLAGKDGSELSLNTFNFPTKYSCTAESASVNGRECPQVTRVDLGCGYGGLTVALAQIYPNELVLGMEIREKVTEYVGKRIRALREQNPGQFRNCSVIRQNAMKFLPNYFRKGQLRSLFFCFPDPHFKTKNWRRRIVNRPLLTLYSYCLEEGGRIYTITDVRALHDWMVSRRCISNRFQV